MRWKRLRRLAQGLALAGAATLVTLLLVELGVRLISPQQLITLRPDIWQPAEVFGWRHTPNADTEINVGEGDVRWRTDALGHRIATEAPQSPPVRRVLALGDSFIEAIQVAYEDTTTAQLERLLSQALGVAVAVDNTGVGGWGPEQYLLEARAQLPRADYDAAVVFVFAGNDRVYQRHVHYTPNQVASRRGLRLPRSLSKRELIDTIAYPINDVLERHSHLFILLRNRAKFLLMRVGLSAHHFPAAVIRSRNTPDAWRLSAEVLTEIAALTRAHAVPLLVVFLPGVYQVDRELGARYAATAGLGPSDYDLDLPSRLLGHALEATDLTWIDTLETLRSAHRAGIAPLYGRVDTHLAPAGHRVVAEAVAPWLLEHLRRARPAPGAP